MSKDKRAGQFIPGATGEGRQSEATAWTFVLEQLNAIHALVAAATTQRDRDIRALTLAAQAMAIPMLHAARLGLHKNPPLVIYANPPKGATMLGRRVYGLEYTHAADGKDYRHDFGPRVRMYELPSGAVLLAHLDGTALVGEYPG